MAAGVSLTQVITAQAEQFERPYTRIKTYLSTPTERHELRFTLLDADRKTRYLKVGDAILDDERAYMGRVAAIHSGTPDETPDWDDRTKLIEATWELEGIESYVVLLEIDPEATLPPNPVFKVRQTPKDGAWMIKTLLPPRRRAILEAEVGKFLDENQGALTNFLRPIAEDVIEHGMKVMEANLNKALTKRGSQIEKLVERHRADLTKELLPVLKKELGPLAKEKAQPILNKIGRELWDELPMWSLGWHAFVDSLPGTKKTRVERWWNTFLENKAIPILRKHEEDLVTALGELIESGAKNAKVRRALSLASRRLAKDPKFKRLVRGILEDALIRPFQAGTLIRKLLNDRTHADRLTKLSQAFAPTMERLAHKLTVDPESGRMDPALARVLRRVVFLKDKRWVEVIAGDEPE